MGADFGHDDGLLAFALQRGPHDLFAVSVVVFPSVVEEVDACVHGAGDNVVHFLQVLRRAQMVTTQRQGGDLETRAAKRPMRHQSYDVLWFLALHSFLAPDLPVSSCRYSSFMNPIRSSETDALYSWSPVSSPSSPPVAYRLEIRVPAATRGCRTSATFCIVQSARRRPAPSHDRATLASPDATWAENPAQSPDSGATPRGFPCR